MRRLILVFASALCASSPALADKGAWLPAGSLASVRADATATLLPSGKVLVAGGSDAGGEIYYKTAELYDPATGIWTPTGDLNLARARHTATLLPTGQVLVVGGFDGSALDTAELYDPAVGMWRLLGDHLAEARLQHTATLLPSGNVLVAGGFGGSGEALRAAQLYDPLTGTWSAAPSPRLARGQQTATLLRSGQVLVAGGRDGQSLVSEAEIYVGTGWISAGQLAQPRICHTATLLPSGAVLVVGGARGNGCGSDGSRFTAATSVELYDPSARQPKWVSSPNRMSTSRALHAAVLLASGKLLVAGGLPPSASAKPTPGSEVYDWQSDTWQPDADLHDFGGNLRQRHTATLLPSGEVLLAGGDRLRSAELYEPSPGFSTRTKMISPAGYTTAPTATLLASGKVLVAGGSFKGVAVANAWIYDPSTATWSPTKYPLAQARVGHTATLLPNGKVLVSGGRTKLDLSKGTPLASVEIYDPVSGAWDPGGQLTPARSGHTATLLPSGKVLFAGGAGAGSSALDSAEIYDPGNGNWSPMRPMQGARFEHAAVLLLTGKVLVAGGSDGAPLGSAELYDPGSDTWSSTGPLLIPRRQATATFLPGGRALLAGGLSTNLLAETEVYDPQEGIWTFGARLQNARSEHTALLLPSGKVLFAGGWNGSSTPLNAVELYDPTLGSIKIGGVQEMRRSAAAALLPSGKVLLAGGTNGSGTDLNTAEVLDLDPGLTAPRPVITSICDKGIDFGSECPIAGHFRSDFEASGGGTNNSAVNRPLVQLLSLEGGQPSWLLPEPQSSFGTDPMTLTVKDLPASLNPGWHRLTVFTSGRAGVSWLVKVGCGLTLTDPENQTVALGQHATFSVTAQGGQTFQWQRKDPRPGSPWVNIVGATGPSYTTGVITGADDGAQFQVTVFGHCGFLPSVNHATLTVSPDTPPTASVLSPRGGEYWPLSRSGDPPRLITWSMDDKVRICKVEVLLVYSTDSGASYPDGNGELKLASFGDSSCPFPGRTETSTAYQVPEKPPSGVAGSLYWIRLKVANPSLSTVVHSSPFYIVQSNPDSVRTLILANVPRMGLSPEAAARFADSLQNLADHPRVKGLVVDLSRVPDIAELYNAWDTDRGNSKKVNELLFGTPQRQGIHDKIRELLAIYTGVKYLVLVGDDRIIPFARIADRTGLLQEKDYDGGTGLPNTTVGLALKDDKILSDDPLAVLGPVNLDDLADRVFVPDLAVGRLVEQPTEIIKTISTFISRDGILDLSLLDDQEGHKVLVTGYDFLQDSGRVIRERWKDALGLPGLPDDALAPVDGTLLTQDWTATALEEHLCGDGQPYAVSFLNGHATHELEGVPGKSVFDIQGLSASAINNNLCGSTSPLNLNGGVVFAVGCHGGLPVPGSSAGERTLDLPQTFMARGAVAYVANTGFGWGLLYGIGYSERLAQILAEEMTGGGVVVTGDAVKNTKLRYFLESPRLDPYDEKSLQQWTFFGLPMYAVKTGIADGSRSQVTFTDVSSAEAERPAVERIGSVVVERRRFETSPETMAQLAAAESQVELPPFLTRLALHFDFSGSGVYTKRGASGAQLGTESVCTEKEKDGCYYTLNGLVDRATGMSDQPIQPYFIYDSRLAGTSQHGVLWKGGAFKEESGWKPVIAELISNGSQGSGHGSLPAHDAPKPRVRPQIIGDNPAGCPVSDRELNSLIVPTGEVLGPPGNQYSIERLFTETDLEVFYFNDTRNPANNCDNSGPTFTSQPPYHQVVDGKKVKWDVQVGDVEVWRVVVVYNTDKEKRWIPLDLNLEGSSWQGELDFETLGATQLAYVIQAVDRRGNVAWLDFVQEKLPDSQVKPDVPLVVEVNLQ